MSIYNKLDLTGWKPRQLTSQEVRFATWIAFFAWVFAVYDFILFGTLLPEIGRHFGWGEVEQAEIATWVAVGTAVVALAIGPIVDKLGRRKGIIFTVAGSALCSALTAIGGAWGKSPLILIRSLGGLGYAEETVNATYLQQDQLAVEIMGRGYAWLDTGTHESLLEAGQFIATLENRQGLKIACPEEIAWRHRWVDAAQLERLAQPLTKNGYGKYLMRILNEKIY